MSLTTEPWAFELFDLDQFYFFSAIVEALIKEQIKKSNEENHPNVYYTLTNNNHVRKKINTLYLL